ncbi:hypothetical protein KIN20_031645 [Parelaphostrongylus tenuis]|uniref:Uncharacterized protein n=1 Tax=Parelaphostrongylus tenuis TaxID=148309 RepID=A0AAD5WH49_PARTN|nr:hypothetical protein KIN20_031645 [Parelaphostrongylus tenuis]
MRAPEGWDESSIPAPVLRDAYGEVGGGGSRDRVVVVLVTAHVEPRSTLLHKLSPVLSNIALWNATATLSPTLQEDSLNQYFPTSRNKTTIRIYCEK